jgi:hypothetical protein
VQCTSDTSTSESSTSDGDPSTSEFGDDESDSSSTDMGGPRVVTSESCQCSETGSASPIAWLLSLVSLLSVALVRRPQPRSS